MKRAERQYQLQQIINRTQKESYQYTRTGSKLIDPNEKLVNLIHNFTCMDLEKWVHSTDRDNHQRMSGGHGGNKRKCPATTKEYKQLRQTWDWYVGQKLYNDKRYYVKPQIPRTKVQMDK